MPPTPALTRYMLLPASVPYAFWNSLWNRAAQQSLYVVAPAPSVMEPPMVASVISSPLCARAITFFSLALFPRLMTESFNP